MSKILEASCVGGVVMCDGVPVPVAEIISLGVGESTGILVMDEDKAYYITSNATDVSDVMEQAAEGLSKAADALAKVATIFATIGASMTGPTTAPPPTLATDLVDLALTVAEVTAVSVELNILKEVLK